MTEPIQPADSLPANRAFVVQFYPATTEGKVRFQGRVEHIASGRARYFSSQQELEQELWKILDRLSTTAVLE